MALVTPRSELTQVFVCKAGDLFADLANADPNGVRRCIGRSVRDFAGWLGWRIGHRLNNAPTNARGQRRWAREARSHLLAIVFALAQIALASIDHLGHPSVDIGVSSPLSVERRGCRRGRLPDGDDETSP